MRFWNWRTGSACILVFLLVASGCTSGNPKTAVVKGKVTLGGKAVPNGTINFIPDSGTSASGEIKPDGTYTLTTYKKGDGAVLGKHKVTIVAMEDMSGKLPEARNPLPPPIVPDKYTSLATTDLVAEVKNEVNEINFDLKDVPKKGR